MPWYHLIPFLCLWERAPWGPFCWQDSEIRLCRKMWPRRPFLGHLQASMTFVRGQNPMLEPDWITALQASGWGETLGKGTYGEVVKAKDKRTRRTNTACVCQKIWKCKGEAKVMHGSCDVVTGRCEPLRSSTRKRCLIQKGGPTSRWKWKWKKGATSWGFWCCGMKPWFEKLKLKLGQIRGT